jgi:hypothetical protein
MRQKAIDRNLGIIDTKDTRTRRMCQSKKKTSSTRTCIVHLPQFTEAIIQACNSTQVSTASDAGDIVLSLTLKITSSLPYINRVGDTQQITQLHDMFTTIGLLLDKARHFQQAPPTCEHSYIRLGFWNSVLLVSKWTNTDPEAAATYGTQPVPMCN